MQALTPTGQLFPYYGTLPGAIAGPNDGQDPVAAITVNTGLLAIANGFEYFAGLTMGTALGAQPPAIAASGPGSGPCRMLRCRWAAAPEMRT